MVANFNLDGPLPTCMKTTTQSKFFDRNNVAKQLEYIKMEAALKVSQLFLLHKS